MPYQRLYDFQPGTKISSSQVDEEFDQLIVGLNDLEQTRYTKTEADGKFETPSGAQEKANATQVHKLTYDDGVAINFSDDLNTLTTPGRYYINGTATNRPESLQGLCVVDRLVSSNGYMQMFIAGTTGRKLFRYYNSGVWGSWKEYASVEVTSMVRAARASTTQSMADSVSTKVVFDVEDLDKKGEFASSRFTPAAKGLYAIIVYGDAIGAIPETSIKTSTAADYVISKAGKAVDSTSLHTFGGIRYIELAAGEWVDFYVLNWLEGGDRTLSSFEIEIVKLK